MSSETQDVTATARSKISLTSQMAASRVLTPPSTHVASTAVANGSALCAVHGCPDATVPLGGSSKRILDIGIAVVAIILLLPPMLLVMGLIKLTMGSPIFFSHVRIGFRGKAFHCYKLRTMVTGADKMLARHLKSDPQAAQEWRETRKLRRDPRVTFIGHLLRKSSLDEVPQLINVLRGEMSCVGPRPVTADELPRYGPHATEYLQTRPGVTGIWQVSGRNSLNYADRIALDSRYVRTWSLWNDLVILGRTVFAVMKFDEAA